LKLLAVQARRSFACRFAQKAQAILGIASKYETCLLCYAKKANKIERLE